MTDHPQQTFELTTQRLGALPVVDWFLARIGLRELLERHLPAGDQRVMLPAAVAIGLLVRNLCVAREPLYAWLSGPSATTPALLGLTADQTALLNDDRVGRSLDQLFHADRGSLLCELMLGVIKEFNVDCSQLHNDSMRCSRVGERRPDRAAVLARLHRTLRAVDEAARWRHGQARRQRGVDQDARALTSTTDGARYVSSARTGRCAIAITAQGSHASDCIGDIEALRSRLRQRFLCPASSHAAAKRPRPARSSQAVGSGVIIDRGVRVSPPGERHLLLEGTRHRGVRL